jgi:hypothetical protein
MWMAAGVQRWLLNTHLLLQDHPPTSSLPHSLPPSQPLDDTSKPSPGTMLLQDRPRRDIPPCTVPKHTPKPFPSLHPPQPHTQVLTLTSSFGSAAAGHGTLSGGSP